MSIFCRYGIPVLKVGTGIGLLYLTQKYIVTSPDPSVRDRQIITLVSNIAGAIILYKVIRKL